GDAGVAAVGAPCPDAVGRDVCEDAHAVPLDLVDPTVTGGKGPARGLHGGDRHGREPTVPPPAGCRVLWRGPGPPAGRGPGRIRRRAPRLAPGDRPPA